MSPQLVTRTERTVNAVPANTNHQIQSLSDLLTALTSKLSERGAARNRLAIRSRRDSKRANKVNGDGMRVGAPRLMEFFLG
ncbi:unnamed protein product [Gemmata massiliana]|uniref:Uncharacterized protein n=1 Tax=Gemmata massiliana TaxID=1210884 RepID=A0A6P2CU03_9BACT|nr:hypothetical protein [Gemmata massiliana]VTR92439.1 unnamed protein product [Gemmata massiliana]